MSSKLEFMIRAIVFIICCPDKFVKLAIEHDTGLPQKENLTGERWKRAQVVQIRQSLKIAFSVVICTLVLGWLFGLALDKAFGPPTRAVSTVVQFLAAGILLGATLAVLSSEIETWDHRTLPEMVNRWLYRAFYALGTFLLTLSLTWTPD